MINSESNILEVKSSFYNKCTNRKKHHDTENNKTSRRISLPSIPVCLLYFGGRRKELCERSFPVLMSTTLTIYNVQGRYGRDVRWAVTRNVCPPCGKGPVSGKMFRSPGLGAIAENRPRDQTDFLHSGFSAI